ncbi:oligosaccharide flippase family protein [Erythrobacter arachoides]|uniref:Oligosaccharide flippase family protein n=1 Tax=Aurantiacibacter arachoides TaxID=1850444 RepID=A0A845A290_9SPHN|nr:oligosaccharide flippase family protein [Aurantiacibacter arachoides]MXO93266.1 oligosaccharide flippase family protein [Aurantiacibacter arachoides]GGD50674.1 hypothetical protein GCM10011411_08180 [Aurantiacibacter arachoides]
MAQKGELGHSARQSIVWGAGFQFLNQAVQFGAMLVLVRLLTPADYGTVSLAQAILNGLTVASFAIFVQHALQARDPATIDWQSHWTAGVVINAVIVTITLAVCFALAQSPKYEAIAAPLAVLTLNFVIGVPASLRQRMLEVNHEWLKLRGLLFSGAVGGLLAALLLAWLGAGYWALVAPAVIFGLPMAIDLFWRGGFRPQWSYDHQYYANALSFGYQRMFSAAAGQGRTFTEQALISAVFSLATLGIYTRASGLGIMLVGQFGGLAIAALYPIITRAEQQTPRFQRLAGLLMRGVTWSMVPAALFLWTMPREIVLVLYGEQWLPVIELLPWAGLSIGAFGCVQMCTTLMLANESRKLVLAIDIATSVLAILLAWLTIPSGPKYYFMATSLLGAAMLGLVCVAMVRTRAMTWSGVAGGLIPPAVAAAGAALAVAFLRPWIMTLHPLLSLALAGTVLGVTYVAILRLAFASSLRALAEILPGGPLLLRVLGYR